MKIIAEIGNTHEGSLPLAKCFIAEAAQCGADCVKFQTHYFGHESLDNAPAPKYFSGEDRKSYFNRTAFSKTEWLALKDFAEDNCGVEFISSPFSHYAADVLAEIGLRTMKVASGEVTNVPLLRHLGKMEIAVILSSGMSDWDELDLAVNELLENGCKKLTVLQCTTSYPTPPNEAGLNILREMSERYSHATIGFSDHTRGSAVAVAALALGAKVFEKHFTLSNKMYGSDAFNAEEPAEFSRYVSDLKTANVALNSFSDKSVSKELAQMKNVFQKSIVALKTIDRGAIIKSTDLDFKKPGNGISAAKIDQVVGRVASKTIIENEQIRFEDLL